MEYDTKLSNAIAEASERIAPEGVGPIILGHHITVAEILLTNGSVAHSVIAADMTPEHVSLLALGIAQIMNSGTFASLVPEDETGTSDAR